MKYASQFRNTFLTLLLLAVPFGRAWCEEFVELEFQLPDPSFGCSLIDYWSPNLELRNFEKRPPFMAPKGTIVISKGKAVKSSVAPDFGNLSQLTDGVKDHQKKSLIELPAGLQWIQIDLEKTSEIYAVLIWHFHETPRVYFDVVVQLSSDPEFKTDVTTIFNNDFDNTAGLGMGEGKEYVEDYKGRLIDVRAIKGRYIRLYSRGNSFNLLNHYTEVEVWGK